MKISFHLEQINPDAVFNRVGGSEKITFAAKLLLCQEVCLMRLFSAR